MHWLDGIDRVNECLIGWPGSSFGIVGSASAVRPAVAELRRTAPEFDRRAVVGVDDVAGGAAAGAVVARVVVGAEELEHRVEQARLLDAEEHGVGAVQRAEAAVAEQALSGLPGLFDRVGNADLEPAAGRRARRRGGRCPAALTSQRGSGSRNGSDALVARLLRASAAGTVCSRCGVPSGA